MKKRFYDQEASVSQAVELLLLLPEDLQSIIADALSAIAEQEFNASEMLHNLKSLGSDKVLSVYKSKQKKRKYDQNPTVHRAMNYMLILSPDNRYFIAQKIIELMGYVQEYLKTCKLHTLTVNVDNMENLRDIYLQFGPEDAKKFLDATEAEFQRNIRGIEPRPDSSMSLPEGFQKRPPAFPDEIAVEKHGMKIRRELK